MTPSSIQCSSSNSSSYCCLSQPFPIMEHSSWLNWPLIHTVMGHDDGDLLEQCYTVDDADDDDFLIDILLVQQPDLSCDTQSFQHPPPIVHNNYNFTAQETERPHHHSSSSKSPRTFILSFDNSTIIPATPEQPPHLAGVHQLGGITAPSSSSSSKSSSSPALSSKKRALDSNNSTNGQNLDPKPSRGSSSHQGGNKRSRNDSQTLDHIMAERKRRQELAERFIALSATIPGLKKTDKATILREAIKYVKQLEERVRELEKQRSNKRSVGEAADQQESSMTKVVLKKKKKKKSEIESSTTTSDYDDDDDWCRQLVLGDNVEARVLELEKEVVVEIQCQKANGIDLKILEHLHSLDLTVTASSALPFGNSTLGITITAQMGEAYRMTVNDLVANLREVLINHITTTTTTDPY